MIPIHHIELNSIDKIYKKYNYLLLQENLPKVKDLCLHELGCLATSFESFLFSDPNAVCGRSNVLVKLVELIVGFGLVKTFEGCEDRDFDAGDFLYEAANAELCFQYLDCLLVEYDHLDTSSKRKFLVQVVLLCATHNKNYLWSSENSVTLCEAFMTNLLICTKHEKLGILLTDETFHPTIFKGILRLMRPILMKDTWMKNPSSCYVFYWIMCHVKHPHLTDYLPDILPPSFMFTSYYVVPHQVVGINCFGHILDNVPPSVIKADGTDEVIFDTLKKYLYLKEKPIVEVLYDCLLKLPMMNLQRVNQIQWSQFDVVVQQLLSHINMEYDPKFRFLFLHQLQLYIKDKPCFKHLKKTLKVLYDNLTDNSFEEEECRNGSLKIMKELLKNCWPRMEHHCFDIMLAILKVMCDIQNSSDAVKTSQVSNLCKECLYMLKHICPEKFMALANGYLKENNLLPGANLLRHLLEEWFF